MPRVKGGSKTRNRHKKVLKLAKGYRGAKSRSYKAANEQVMHSLMYAYRDRRVRKRNFRSLWISRINAAARNNGLSYSKFINGLKMAEIEVNRKMLSEMAVNDPEGFGRLADLAKEKIGA